MSDTTGAKPPGPVPDVLALLRSRNYLALLVMVAILGVAVAAAAYWFLDLVGNLQKWIFNPAYLPKALGFHGEPVWWPLPTVCLAGILVGLTIRYLPGRGGHSPADGFAMHGPPARIELPGVVLAALAGLALGAVIGPEAPLIAIGGGLAAGIIRTLKKDLPEQSLRVVAAAGSFSAISTLLGSPLSGAFLLMEASGLSGPMLGVVLVPGLLAAGIGSLIFLGFDSWTGHGTFSLAIPGLTHIGHPTGAEFGWALVIGIAAVILGGAIRWLALWLKPYVEPRTVVLCPLVGLAVGGLAVAYAEGSGKSSSDVLFSGQTALPSLVTNSAAYSVGALLLLIACKGLAYGSSLSAFRGGPIFPSMFIGGAGGILMSHLPGLPLVAGVAMGIGAMMTAMLGLPLTAVLITTIILGSAGITVMPLVIVAVVVTYVGHAHFAPRPRPGPGGRGSTEARRSCRGQSIPSCLGPSTHHYLQRDRLLAGTQNRVGVLMARLRPRHVIAAVSAASLSAAALSMAGPAQTALASGATLYAYAQGSAASPSNCPKTSESSDQCSLAHALAQAAPGDVVALATPGRGGHYVGNWIVGTAGTTSSTVLTIRPAAGVTGPILDGNKGEVVGCGTKTCDGPVLTAGAKVHLDLDAVTIRDANDTTSGLGGAIENIHGGVVMVSHSTFFHNYANANGGAIDNGDVSGTGTLVVKASSFSSNSAVNGDGGAIANGDVGGHGSVVISGSTFSSNSAINGNGGAIDSGDTQGGGALTLSTSTFVGNVAGRAGAVDNADNGEGTLTVTGCTFSNNVAALDDGGAIDNADWSGKGTLRVSGSTFSDNKTLGDGGAIDNADNTGSVGNAQVSTSTFWANIADVHGGAIDSSDVGSAGTMVIWASTFSRNNANNVYTGEGKPGGSAVYLGSRGALWAAANILNGACLSSGGTWYDRGYNIARNSTCLRGAKGDVGDSTLSFGPLAADGGPTKTVVPSKGNPAIGAIPYMTSVRLRSRTITLCPALDQRGQQDKGTHHCDVGSVQSSN